MLGRRLRQRQQPPTTRHELGVTLQDEWNDLNQVNLGLLIVVCHVKYMSVSQTEGDLHDTDSIFTSWSIWYLRVYVLLPSSRENPWSLEIY